MAGARRLRQPGPAAEARVESAVGRMTTLDFTLQPGLTLNAAVAGPLVAAGFNAAQVEFSGGAFGPFTYVMPAAAPDDAHAAWYSAPFTPAGESWIEAGCLTFGRKESAPFVHCHAFWREPDGTRRGGHVMPHETVVSAPVEARAYGSADVAVTADFDPETRFTLFTPHALRAPEAGPRIAFARVCPNTDIASAVAELCRRHQFTAGRLVGSIGSLIGARFANGSEVEDHATELFVRAGRVAPGADGTFAAEIDIAIVGLSGVLAEGRLAGDNPVCITFELAVEEVDAAVLS
ncbi:PCC domain-containing protein [Xanthobacter sediminis]